MAKKFKWYVVWVGDHPGIYDNWEDCKMQINNYPNAKYKSFIYKEDAIRAYRGKPEDHMELLRAIAKVPNKVVNYEAIPDVVFDSIAVDAACSGNPGKMEYRGVDIMTGRQIFHKGPFDQGTNNIGEFLALVHGLALMKQQGSNKAIYSDSKTAMAWVRDKKCKTKLTPNAKNAQLLEIVKRAENWLLNNSYSNRILKWDTEQWGEIPADFGRK